MSNFPYEYHNYQADGDQLDSSNNLAKGERAVLEVVRQAIQIWEQHRIKTGLKHRLIQAWHYQRYQIPQYIAFSDEYYDDYDSDNAIDGDEDVHELPADDICRRMCPNTSVFTIDYIRQKHNIVMSLVLDAIKFRGANYATLEPTPVVDASEESRKKAAYMASTKLFQDVMTESIIQAQQTGSDPEVLFIDAMTSMLTTDEGTRAYDDIVASQVKLINSSLTASAKVKAKNAENAVNDAVSESNFDRAEYTQISQSFWYDFGVLRTPEIVSKKTTKIDDDGYLKEVQEKVWQHTAVHPLNYIFSPNRSFTDYGDFEGDIVKLSIAELERMKKLDGAREREINDLIKKAPIYRDFSGFLADEVYDDDVQEWTELDRVTIVRLNIRLSAGLCRKLFRGDRKLSSSNESREVELWCTRDHILRAKLEPYYLDYRPYKLNAFTIPDESDLCSARGLFSILKPHQEMVINSLVQWRHSLKYIQKAILEINSDKLRDKDDSLIDDYLKADIAVIPTKAGKGAMNYGGNDRAIYVNQLPDKTNVFIMSLREAVSIMDDVSFPSFAAGTPNLPSSIRSTGSLSIMQANSNKPVQKFFLQQESNIQSPCFEYIWKYLCLKNRDRSITVDSKILASSYSGFIQRDQKRSDIQQAFQSLSSIISSKFQYDQVGLDSRWVDQFIIQLAEESGMDINKLPVKQSQDVMLPQQSGDIVQQPIDELTPVNNVPQDINTIV